MTQPDNAIALLPEYPEREAKPPTRDAVLAYAYTLDDVDWDELRNTLASCYRLRVTTLDNQRDKIVTNDPTHPAHRATQGLNLAQDGCPIGQNNIAAAISEALSTELRYDPVAQSFYAKAGNLWAPILDPVARHRIADCLIEWKPAYNYGYLSAVANFIKDGSCIPEWSNVPGELPLQNGVFSLTDRSLRDYRDDDYYNWQLPYSYDPKAKCPEITRALKNWADDCPDLHDFLMCWLYCVLTRRHQLQKYLELIGTGGTGKSSFMSLCTLLVGESNRTVTELKQLENNQFESAGLYGKSLVLITDAEQHRGEVAQLKKITGGDPIRNEVKNKQQGQPFIFLGKVVIAANEAIASKDYTSGQSGRRIPLTFRRKVTDEDIRRHKKEPHGISSVFEREMPGLLNLLLELDPAHVDKTITHPADAIHANALQIELDSNPILAWANDYLVACARDDETNIGTAKDKPGTRLYATYIDWSEGQKREPVSGTRFSNLLIDQLEAKGIDTRKSRQGRGRFLKGLRLRKTTDKEPTLITREDWRNAGV